MPKQQEFALFNLNNNAGQSDAILELDSTIPQVQLQPKFNQDSRLNIDNLASEILEQAEKQKKEPILNIQVRSNAVLPIIDEEEVAKLKEVGIKVVFSFERYDSSGRSRWQPILNNADHVFFANDQDRASASENHISPSKASYVQPSPNLEESEILSRKPNILMSDGLEDIKQINKVVDAAKSLPNTRVILALNNPSQKSATNAIAAKFGINDQDQLVGIGFEVEEILQDKVNGPKKLEAYVSQLTEQFQKADENINPVDIYFDFSNPGKIHDIQKQAKYTMDTGTHNFTSSCIALGQQGGNTKEELINEVQAREASNGPNEVAIAHKQEVLGQAQAKTTQVLQNIVSEPQGTPKLNTPEQSRSNSISQPDYLYTDQDISTLLHLSLNEDKVAIQPVLSLDPGYTEVLRESMLGALTSVSEGKDAAVIPLETGGAHWVGLAITKDTEGKIVFTYNDPKGTPIGVREDLVKMIKEIAPEAQIADLKTPQQINDKDCGAFVTDNLVKMVTGQPILTTEAAKDAGGRLRIEHSAAIAKKEATEKATHMRGSIQHNTERPRANSLPTATPNVKATERPRSSGFERF